MNNITSNLSQQQVSQAIQEWIFRHKKIEDAPEIGEAVEVMIVPVLIRTNAGNLTLNGMRVQIGNPGSIIPYPDGLMDGKPRE